MTPTLTTAQEFQAAYDHFNRRLFNGELPACLITLQRTINCMGYYFFERFVRADGQRTDEIAMNPEFFAGRPILETLQTLVHEMAHMWQYHFGKPSVKSYHNKQWAAKMEAIGLMPSSTGAPGGARTGQQMADYAIAGSAFMLASEELVSNQFQVSWCDRFFVPMRVSLGSTDEGKALSAVSSLLAVQPVSSRLVSPIQSESRSTRSKYRCPSCEVQAWGKPGLRLLCEECEQSLEDVGA